MDFRHRTQVGLYSGVTVKSGLLQAILKKRKKSLLHSSLSCSTLAILSLSLMHLFLLIPTFVTVLDLLRVNTVVNPTEQIHFLVDQLLQRHLCLQLVATYYIGTARAKHFCTLSVRTHTCIYDKTKWSTIILSLQCSVLLANLVFMNANHPPVWEVEQEKEPKSLSCPSVIANSNWAFMAYDGAESPHPPKHM